MKFYLAKRKRSKNAYFEYQLTIIKLDVAVMRSVWYVEFVLFDFVLGFRKWRIKDEQIYNGEESQRKEDLGE